jgi:hypothetical protein
MSQAFVTIMIKNNKNNKKNKIPIIKTTKTFEYKIIIQRLHKNIYKSSFLF